MYCSELIHESISDLLVFLPVARLECVINDITDIICHDVFFEFCFCGRIDNQRLNSDLQNLGTVDRYSFEYFLLLPFALSTGYFFSLFAIFLTSAWDRSMSNR